MLPFSIIYQTISTFSGFNVPVNWAEAALQRLFIAVTTKQRNAFPKIYLLTASTETALLLRKKAAGGKSKGNVVRGECAAPTGAAWSAAPQPGLAHRPELLPDRILWLLQQWNWLKRQISMKTTSVLMFLPWTDRRTDRKWRGKKTKCWKGFEESAPGSVLMSSLWHFTEIAIFILQNGGGCDIPGLFLSVFRWVGEPMESCGRRHQLSVVSHCLGSICLISDE